MPRAAPSRGNADMDLLHFLILGLVQGITEFLPISSSAHLILLPIAFGWQDQGLAHDIAAHVGSLCAVLIYFRADLQRMTLAVLAPRPERAADRRLAWYLVLGTLPVVASGLLLRGEIETVFRSALFVAATTLLFGALLGLADWCGRRNRGIDTVGLRDALLIGLGQALAVLPGTSRSGITMTVALALGLDRTAAARFSFLLSVPAILGAGMYGGWVLLTRELAPQWTSMAVVAVAAAFSAFATIHYFLRFIQRIGMLPFVAYRLVLGVVLLVAYL
jgi:undecaprenyl-diphosphatase